MTKKFAAKFNKKPSGVLSDAQIKRFNERMDPFNSESKKIGQTPFYSTGARTLIRIGGLPVTVAQSIRWRVAYNGQAIHTIDTPFAWDIDVGQVSIEASLESTIDPTKGPEADNMLGTMQSAVHAPIVELQVLDASGTSIFYARGMFLEVAGNISLGSLSSWSARFKGIAYQHYVGQNFKPYNSVQAATGKLLGGLKNIASDITGGIL